VQEAMLAWRSASLKLLTEYFLHFQPTHWKSIRLGVQLPMRWKPILKSGNGPGNGPVNAKVMEFS